MKTLKRFAYVCMGAGLAAGLAGFLGTAGQAQQASPLAATPWMITNLLRNAQDAATARSALGIVTSNWVFNPNQLEAPGNTLQVKSGATLTNPIITNGVFSGDLTRGTNAPGTLSSVQAVYRGWHAGATTANGFKEGRPEQTPYWYYAASGTGVVRNVEWTSEVCEPVGFSRAYSIRAYVDGGSLPDVTKNISSNYLVLDIPLSSLLGTVWVSNAVAFHAETRWFNATVYAPRQEGFGWPPGTIGSTGPVAGYITIGLKMPMPYTNGIWLGMWYDAGNSTYSNGFAYASADLGPLPAGLEGYRLRSYSVSNEVSYSTPITNLVWNAPGELVGMLVSFRGNGSGPTYLEGQWHQTIDAGADNLLGCAGGEDLAYNGWYASGGSRMRYDFGNYYLLFAGNNALFEYYRLFPPAEAPVWKQSALMAYRFYTAYTGTLDYQIISLFYGK